MRLLVIDPADRVVKEETIAMPEGWALSIAEVVQIMEARAWGKPMSYSYSGHFLWVDEASREGPAFVLTERETTLGPFHGKSFVVAKTPQGVLTDATIQPGQLLVTWAAKVGEGVDNGA